MLELKRILEEPATLAEMLRKRHFTLIDPTEITAKIERTRSLRGELDQARNERNTTSKEIGKLMGAGKKEEAEAKKGAMRELGDKMESLEAEATAAEAELNETILALPNWIDDSVPEGGSESDNRELRKVGNIRDFDFEPRPHYEIGERTGIIDFERGVKLAGSRFYTYRGLGAALERAILNFMLDTHTGRNGYSEAWVPQLIDDAGMTTTGQYPKFKGDFYRLNDDGLSLIPTAEVPLVNLYRDEILDATELPLALTAASSCFRREAGAAGRDTRGLVRVHQFQKVELVQICRPEESSIIHEAMLSHAESILQALELPYRVVLLCSGDMGATARRTYDIEVWMPGLNRYLEISSVSNCGDYQARRGMIRYREAGGKPQYVHTLNGSGLAAGRTMAAIIENYQQADGNFTLPDALKPWLGRGSCC